MWSVGGLGLGDLDRNLGAQEIYAGRPAGRSCSTEQQVPLPGVLSM